MSFVVVASRNIKRIEIPLNNIVYINIYDLKTVTNPSHVFGVLIKGPDFNKKQKERLESTVITSHAFKVGLSDIAKNI